VNGLANALAQDYLAAIKDEASAAHARDPAHIDTLIFSIIDLMHTAGTDEPAHVVGVPPALG
jgi:hypothetical protein